MRGLCRCSSVRIWNHTVRVSDVLFEIVNSIVIECCMYDWCKRRESRVIISFVFFRVFCTVFFFPILRDGEVLGRRPKRFLMLLVCACEAEFWVYLHGWVLPLLVCACVAKLDVWWFWLYLHGWVLPLLVCACAAKLDVWWFWLYLRGWVLPLLVGAFVADFGGFGLVLRGRTLLLLVCACVAEFDVIALCLCGRVFVFIYWALWPAWLGLLGCCKDIVVCVCWLLFRFVIHIFKKTLLGCLVCCLFGSSLALGPV